MTSDLKALAGFTLLELILVLAVAALFMVAGVRVYQHLAYQSQFKLIVQDKNRLFEDARAYFYARCVDAPADTAMPAGNVLPGFFKKTSYSKKPFIDPRAPQSRAPIVTGYEVHFIPELVTTGASSKSRQLYAIKVIAHLDSKVVGGIKACQGAATRLSATKPDKDHPCQLYWQQMPGSVQAARDNNAGVAKGGFQAWKILLNKQIADINGTHISPQCQYS